MPEDITNTGTAVTADTAAPQLSAVADAQAAVQPKPEKTIKVRVLVDCEHGRCNTLAELPSAVAKAAKRDGLVDDDKSAVAAVS